MAKRSEKKRLQKIALDGQPSRASLEATLAKTQASLEYVQGQYAAALQKAQSESDAHRAAFWEAERLRLALAAAERTRDLALSTGRDVVEQVNKQNEVIKKLLGLNGEKRCHACRGPLGALTPDEVLELAVSVGKRP